jgi:type I restriction enzyme, S subunit
VGWPVARLSEITTIFGGGTPSRQESSYFGSGIPWATPTDVTKLNSLYIDATAEFVTDSGIRNSSTKLLPSNAVLLTSRATIGFTAVTRVPMCTNQGFANFVCGEHLLPEFLAYWLRTQKDRLIQIAGGTTFKEVSRGNLRHLRVPIPPIPEQRRIVEILDRAAAIQRLRKAAEEKAREIIPALFVDMFGDPETNPKGWQAGTLGDIIGEFRYGTSVKSGPTGMPVLRIPNVVGGELDTNDMKLVRLSDGELRRLALHDGDILFVRTNGNPDYVGRSAVYRGQVMVSAGFGPNSTVYASYLIRARLRPDNVPVSFNRSCVPSMGDARCESRLEHLRANITSTLMVYRRFLSFVRRCRSNARSLKKQPRCPA